MTTIGSIHANIGYGLRSGVSATAASAKGAVGGLPFLFSGGLRRYSEFWECLLPCLFSFWLGVVAVLILLALCACGAGARWWWVYASHGGPAEPEVEVPLPTQTVHGGLVRGGLRKRPLSGGPRPDPGSGAVLLQRGVDKWRPVAGGLFPDERSPSPAEEERAAAEDSWAAASRPRSGAVW